MLDKQLRLVRTLRNLHLAQVAHRLRLRGQLVLVRAFPRHAEALWDDCPSDPPGWPADYAPLMSSYIEGFPSAPDNAVGVFHFLAEEGMISSSEDWEQLHMPLLWRFHLHYFDWAWSFRNHPDRAWARSAFGHLLGSWRRGTALGHLAAWSPYVASIRAWNLCGVHAALLKDHSDETEVLHLLCLHAGFIRRHLEFDVGGNHLIKNLKALIGLGVFLGTTEMVDNSLPLLRRQLDVQVLGDGGHFERSPSYHAQVLEDLADIASLLSAVGRTPPRWLTSVTSRMRHWLGAILHPDGDVPLFNDCILIGQQRLSALHLPAIDEHVTVLADSGYVIVRVDGDSQVVADVGAPCPPELPAHCHADALSFELSVHGIRTVIDSGVSTYDPGKWRTYERSSHAHSTIVVDGIDQTEVWETFRAARLADVRLLDVVDRPDEVTILAEHSGYVGKTQGRPVHRRTWQVHTNDVEITDDVRGNGKHHLEWLLHLAPDLRPVVTESGVFTDRVCLAVDHELRCNLALIRGQTEPPMGWASSAFGERHPSTVVVLAGSARLPVSLKTRLFWEKR